jgi:hypothetical protein
MKKLSNAIFGKESKFHKDEVGESVTSERHLHPEYEGATVVTPAPAVVAAPIREERIEREVLIEQQATMIQPTLPIQEEARVEARERPAVVHEKVYQVEREEIQPVIHREREKTEIVQIEAPRYESEIRPTIVHERQLPAETRPEVRGSTAQTEMMYQEFGRIHQSTMERAPVEHRVYEKPAIVEEHIRRTIIEEVQPVIHKEVVEPHIIRETLPIYEKIVEAPVVTRIVKEIEGLHIDEHHRHHAHHSQFLRGEFDCLDCKKFHSLGTCTVCSPTMSYEGCRECLSLREKGFIPTQQFVYSKGTPLGMTSGMPLQSGLSSGYVQSGYTSGISQPGYGSGFTSGMAIGLGASGVYQSIGSHPITQTGLGTSGLTSGVTSGLSSGYQSGYSSGLTQPGYSSGVTSGLSTGGLSQPSMTSGYSSGLSQPGYTSGVTSGFSQPGMTSGLSTGGLSQPGMTSGLSTGGLSQPGMTSGIPQQMGSTGYYGSGVTQPGLSSGLSQPGYTSGVTQPGLTSGVTQPGLTAPSGLTQGLQQGLATGHPIQGLEQGAKQSLSNVEGQMGSSLMNKSAQNFASSVSQSRVLPESSQTQKFL